MMVADYRVARRDPRLCPLRPRAGRERSIRRRQQALLGKGHLAMTVDQGPDMERYQGIVPLDGNTLTEAAHTYFAQSEQIPTRLRLSAGPLLGRGRRNRSLAGGRHHGAASAARRRHQPDAVFVRRCAARASRSRSPEDDDWVKARLLLDTVEDHELLDPTLSPEELLYRLYHEDGVTVYPAGRARPPLHLFARQRCGDAPALSRRRTRRHGRQRRNQRHLRILLGQLPV